MAGDENGDQRAGRDRVGGRRCRRRRSRPRRSWPARCAMRRAICRSGSSRRFLVALEDWRTRTDARRMSAPSCSPGAWPSWPAICAPARSAAARRRWRCSRRSTAAAASSNAVARLESGARPAAPTRPTRCGRMRGASSGLLHGVPLAHKDMFYRAGQLAECGAALMRGHRPDGHRHRPAPGSTPPVRSTSAG